MEKRRTNNIRSFASPGKYIQGARLLDQASTFIKMYGANPVFIIDGNLFESIVPKIKKQYPQLDELHFVKNTLEITTQSLESFQKKIELLQNVDVFVAIGGGKTIDTGKIISANLRLPIVVVPTAASTDAPTSGLSVVYKESGEHSHEIFLNKNPELVLVDSQLIADAPVRLLVAGMGDALATCFEAKANEYSNHNNVVSESVGMSLGATLAAKMIAQLSYDVLIRDGVQAKHAAEAHVVTPALENIIEANTLLSGIGFECNGTAAAHAINDGFTALKAPTKLYHGERVAFGVLCQLVLENADPEIINEVFDFCYTVGLPITLEDMKVPSLTEEELDKIAEGAYNNVIHAEPIVITKDMIKGCILVADSIGRTYK